MKAEVSTNSDSIIDPPLIVDDPAALTWSEQADVVVVGFGGAGASAALQAAECGASVLLIDRFNGGGATAYSGGIFYAGGTSIQQQAGFQDTAEEMRKYLAQEVGDAVSADTLERFCQGSAADLDWLIGYGVPYSSKAFLGKTTYPPEGYFLYYSGAEDTPQGRAVSKPAPRGHRPRGSGLTGHVYFAALRAAIDRSKVVVGTHARATRLILRRDGRVLGLEVLELPQTGNSRERHDAIYRRAPAMKPWNAAVAQRAIDEARSLEDTHGVRRLIRAQSGVILATGGFAFSRKLMREHGPVFADNFASLLPLASLGCDGSGIELGTSAGGSLGKMNSIFAFRVVAPPIALLRGVLVDRNGKRFVSEDGYGGDVGRATAAMPGGHAWLILSQSTVRSMLREVLSCRSFTWLKLYLIPALLNLLFGGTRRARSIEQLAERLGMSPAALRQTIDVYNADARLGRDRLGKDPKNTVPLDKGPFFALNMSIGNRFGFVQTMSLGGLKVNEATGQVIDPEGQAITGLYAAGRAAVGICSVGYYSGMSLSDGVFSGRRAGRHAAEQAHAGHAPRIDARMRTAGVN
jgi:3-oxo-5alpha-steroid 4-dehydrogenase